MERQEYPSYTTKPVLCSVCGEKHALQKWDLHWLTKEYMLFNEGYCENEECKREYDAMMVTTAIMTEDEHGN